MKKSQFNEVVAVGLDDGLLETGAATAAPWKKCGEAVKSRGLDDRLSCDTTPGVAVPGRGVTTAWEVNWSLSFASSSEVSIGDAQVDEKSNRFWWLTKGDGFLEALRETAGDRFIGELRIISKANLGTSPSRGDGIKEAEAGRA